MDTITETRRDLPCANPDLVDSYESIERLLQGESSDFEYCEECDKVLCDHALDSKREDGSYKVLVQHFRNGGKINQPILNNGYQSNGHHRLVAALDAGFTHVPVRRHGWGDHNDWEGTDVEKYGFELVDDGWDVQVAQS